MVTNNDTQNSLSVTTIISAVAIIALLVHTPSISGFQKHAMSPPIRITQLLHNCARAHTHTWQDGGGRGGEKREGEKWEFICLPILKTRLGGKDSFSKRLLKDWNFCSSNIISESFFLTKKRNGPSSDITYYAKIFKDGRPWDSNSKNKCLRG